MKSRLAILLICYVALTAFYPRGRDKNLRTAGEMQGSMVGINLIQRGFLLDDMGRVVRGSDDIIKRARELRETRSALLGLPAMRRPTFNKLIDKLILHAKSVRKAAEKGKTSKAMSNFRAMVEDGCLPCHRAFRFRGVLEPKSVTLMSALTSDLEEIDRGVLLGDYVLVGIHAAEIKRIAGLMQENQMVEGTFQMGGTEKEHFRKFSEVMGKTADRIAQAAEVRSQQLVITAIRDMTEKSCLACHKALRIDPFLRSWRR